MNLLAVLSVGYSFGMNQGNWCKEIQLFIIVFLVEVQYPTEFVFCVIATIKIFCVYQFYYSTHTPRVTVIALDL